MCLPRHATCSLEAGRFSHSSLRSLLPTHMQVHKTSRRMFLQGLGGATLAIPFLQSLLPRDAWAQTANVPKRYIGIWSSYDYGHARHWYPTLNPLTQTVQRTGEAPVGYQSLRSIIGTNPALSKVLGPGLTPHLG